MARRHQGGIESLSYFIVGGLAGAALGLMLAPEDGSSTRDGIAGRFRGLADRLWGRGPHYDLTPPHEHGELLFSNRPEQAADVADPLLSGEALNTNPRPGKVDPIDE